MSGQSPRANSIRFSVTPRDVPPEKAARRLGLTPAQFELVKEGLFTRGFPGPDPDTGNFDLVAIDTWMDKRHNIVCSDGLTQHRALRNASEVFGERARRLLDG